MNKKTLLFSILFFSFQHGIAQLSDASRAEKVYIKDPYTNPTQSIQFPGSPTVFVVHFHMNDKSIVNNGNATATNTATQETQAGATVDSATDLDVSCDADQDVSNSIMDSEIEHAVQKSIQDAQNSMKDSGIDHTAQNLVQDSEIKQDLQNSMQGSMVKQDEQNSTQLSSIVNDGSGAAVDKKRDESDLHSFAFLLDNKLKIFGLAVCFSYAWTTYRIHLANQILSSHDSWCNWKSAVPLHHLALSSNQDLVSQLNIDLQKKHYLNHSNSPKKQLCQLFFSDLQEEMVCLRSYLKILKSAKAIRCSQLFFFSYDQLIIEEKLARLSFVFDLFIRMQADDAR